MRFVGSVRSTVDLDLGMLVTGWCDATFERDRERVQGRLRAP
jgi:hypothetical protein